MLCNKKNFLLIILFTFCCAQNSQATNIIFALDELLFTVDKKTLNDILGHENISTKLGFWWYGGYTSKAALVKDIMDKLKSIPNSAIHCQEHQAYYTGQKVAPILCEWVLGFRPSKEIQSIIINHLHAQTTLDPWVKTKFLEMAYIGLDPEKLMHVVQLVPEGIALLKKCYETRRHNLYILSNCPAEIFDRLVYKHSDIFALFNGAAISSKIHLIKPHSAIYNYLLTTYQLNPYDCLYIGTTPDGLITAQQLGMKTILWDPYNYAPGLAILTEMGILD